MARNADLLLALAAAVALAVLAWPRGGGLSAARADWTLTPGVLNPDVTQATIAETICKHGWTSTIRPPSDYTTQLKRTQMRDYGRSFDPRTVPPPDLDALPESGMGAFIIQGLMDEIHYRPGHPNVLTLVKRLT